MENRQGYDPSEFEDDDYMNPQPAADKSIRGYRIVIIILSAILVALSVLYYSIHRQQMIDNELLQADRDSIQNDLGRLMTDYDNLQISNDSISANLTLERERADSLMTRLKKERSWNLAKIKQYEKEVGTLRTIMRGYVRQIDSLNTLNKKLIKENVGFRKEISSANLRAEMAEEKAAELYVRITSPDGYVLTTEEMPTFEFEGERLSYSAMREVEYDNTKDLGVGIFYTSTGFTAGTYKIQIYCEGRLIGQTDVAMR